MFIPCTDLYLTSFSHGRFSTFYWLLRFCHKIYTSSTDTDLDSIHVENNKSEIKAIIQLWKITLLTMILYILYNIKPLLRPAWRQVLISCTVQTAAKVYTKYTRLFTWPQPRSCMRVPDSCSNYRACW